MLKTRSTLALFVTATLATPSTADQAPEVRIGKVRQAAIDKMQNNLGTMRGSIKPKQHNIFLTGAMIDRLKPIRPGQAPDKQAERAPTEISTYVNEPSIDGAEIYKEFVANDPVDLEDSDTVSKTVSNIGEPEQLPVPDREVRIPEIQLVLKTKKLMGSDQQLPKDNSRSARLQREIFKAIHNPL